MVQTIDRFLEDAAGPFRGAAGAVIQAGLPLPALELPGRLGGRRPRRVAAAAARRRQGRPRDHLGPELPALGARLLRHDPRRRRRRAAGHALHGGVRRAGTRQDRSDGRLRVTAHAAGARGDGAARDLLRGAGGAELPPGRAAAGGARRRGPGRDHVHLRHYRRRQGGDAHPPQPAVQPGVGPRGHPRRPVAAPAVAAAAQPHVRADGLAVLGVQLRGEHHLRHQPPAVGPAEAHAGAQDHDDAAGAAGARPVHEGHRAGGGQPRQGAGVGAVAEAGPQPAGGAAPPRVRPDPRPLRRQPADHRLRRRRPGPDAGREVEPDRHQCPAGLRRHRGVAGDQYPPAGRSPLRLGGPAGAGRRRAHHRRRRDPGARAERHAGLLAGAGADGARLRRASGTRPATRATWTRRDTSTSRAARRT